jgi:hypothetical protein
VHASASPGNLEVLRSPVPDIQIVDPSQPDFENYVREIVPDAAGREAIAPALPYSITLRNIGVRRITWVTVRYTYTDADGRPGSSVLAWDCRGSAARPSPGIIVLITPDGQFTEAVWTRSASSLPSSGLYSERVGRMEALAKSPKVIASLDSAVYDNGEFVGPDVSGRFSDMKMSAARMLALVNGVRAMADGPDEGILTFLDRFAEEKPGPGMNADQTRAITRIKTRAMLLRDVLDKQGRAFMDVSLGRLALEAQSQLVWRAETPR